MMGVVPPGPRSVLVLVSRLSGITQTALRFWMHVPHLSVPRSWMVGREGVGSGVGRGGGVLVAVLVPAFRFSFRLLFLSSSAIGSSNPPRESKTSQRRKERNASTSCLSEAEWSGLRLSRTVSRGNVESCGTVTSRFLTSCLGTVLMSTESITIEPVSRSRVRRSVASSDDLPL